jgi:hypothetical protein
MKYIFCFIVIILTIRNDKTKGYFVINPTILQEPKLSDSKNSNSCKVKNTEKKDSEAKL